MEKESEKIIVEKSKDHRLCTKRFGGVSQRSITGVPVKSPFWMLKSKSVCRQEIESGLVQAVTCHDMNEVTPMPGTLKTLHAHQKSLLKLKRVSSLKNVKEFQQIKRSNLIFDMTYSPKDPSQNMVLESQLKEMCVLLSKQNITKETAKMYTNMIHTMDRVEETFISTLLEKIRRRSICEHHKVVENLYLDAVSYTINAGAIPVMVNELKNGSRVIQYTMRLHTLPQVCIHGVRYVQPLFEDDHLPISVTMAAGSVVNRHCAMESCHSAEPVKHIMSIVAGKIKKSCAKSGSNETQSKITLAQLKAVGNMKNATLELRSAIEECFKTKIASQIVKLAAAEALRVLPCNAKVNGNNLRNIFISYYKIYRRI